MWKVIWNRNEFITRERRRTVFWDLGPTINFLISKLKKQKIVHLLRWKLGQVPLLQNPKYQSLWPLTAPLDSKQTFQSSGDLSTSLSMSSLSKSTKVEARAGPTSSKSRLSKVLTASSSAETTSKWLSYSFSIINVKV